MNGQEKDEVLETLLKRVLFDQDGLGILKEKITQLRAGEISAKEFKISLVKARYQMLKELLELFPFYASRKAGTNNGDQDGRLVEEWQKKVNEREELLVEVTDRVEKMLQEMAEIA